jgi:hypothetical protein
MRELVCLFFALPTNSTWFNIFGLMISLEIWWLNRLDEDRRNVGEGIWKREKIKKDRRTYREIWEECKTTDRCRFHDHTGEKCCIAVESVELAETKTEAKQYGEPGAP